MHMTSARKGIESKRRQNQRVISEKGEGFKQHRMFSNKAFIFSLNERTNVIQ